MSVRLNALMAFAGASWSTLRCFRGSFFMNEKPARSHGGQETLCVSQNQHEVSIFLRCFLLLAIKKCDPKRPYMTMTCLTFFLFRMWLGCLISPKDTLLCDYDDSARVKQWGCIRQPSERKKNEKRKIIKFFDFGMFLGTIRKKNLNSDYEPETHNSRKERAREKRRQKATNVQWI